MNFFKTFSNQCKYANECPFYQKPDCDNYYESGIRCGIEREKTQGQSWEQINQNHHKTTGEIGSS